ncbi:MAG: DUF192 domain-containing protein [Candidatus Omnitrophota bacterium]|nr:DUF192 domain-containing protein [Candidatus Omnitrophota bacterium]
MKSKYIYISVSILLVILFSLLLLPFFRLPQERKKINISGKEISVWVARTDKEREQGLQNIMWLPKNTGMLFIFSKQSNRCFWNKNTFLKLKLIFLKEGKEVKASHLSSIWEGKKTICSDLPVDSVLELVCE